MRLIRFIKRFRNQWRIHGHLKNMCFLYMVRMAWIQSRKKKDIEFKAENVTLEDLDAKLDRMLDEKLRDD